MSLIICPSFDHEIPLFKAHCPPYFSFGVGTYVVIQKFFKLQWEYRDGVKRKRDKIMMACIYT